MQLDSDTFDVVLLGTGLAQSIAAAALAKAGKSVLHLDPNDYYGGEQASLTLDELQEWAAARAGPTAIAAIGGAPSAGCSPRSSSPGELPISDVPNYDAAQQRRYTNATTTPLSADLHAARRRYAISLFPALMPARGTLVSTLISSDVAKYVSFRLLDGVSIWDSDASAPRRVPGSKEDVFKDKSISLLDKRRLMKCLMFIGEEFDDDELLDTESILSFLISKFTLPRPLAEAVTYAIAHAASPEEPARPALVRARRYLRAMGRYGPGAFLIGQYGGAGEVAQGFCRACAVYGGTYVLGEPARPTRIALATRPASSSAELSQEGTEQAPCSTAPADSLSNVITGVEIDIPAHPRSVFARNLVAAPAYLPSALAAARHSRPSSAGRLSSEATPGAASTGVTAHAIVLVNERPSVLVRPPGDDGEVEHDDTGVVIFPPGTTAGAVTETDASSSSPLVSALVMGEGTGSCPAGQWIVYLWTEATSTSDPRELLRPYVDLVAARAPEGDVATAGPEEGIEGQTSESKRELTADTGLTTPTESQAPSDIEPVQPSPLLFESYYLDHGTQTDTTPAPEAIVRLGPYNGSHTLTEGLDWEADRAEEAFWGVVGTYTEGHGFFEREQAEGEGEGEAEGDGAE